MAIHRTRSGPLGPIPRTTVGFEHLRVDLRKFTKWPEIEPIKKVTVQSAIKFLMGLVYHFGMTNHVITNNGTQLTSSTLMTLLE